MFMLQDLLGAGLKGIHVTLSSLSHTNMFMLQDLLGAGLKGIHVTLSSLRKSHQPVHITRLM